MPKKTLELRGYLRFKKKIANIIPDARTQIARDIKAEIVDIIVKKIVSGNSPVKGSGRYKKYSDGYAKYKGRKQPVDLVDSGDMLNSLTARIKVNKNVEVYFKSSDARKIAGYHQFGKGNNPVRKILPVGNDEFKADIVREIVKIMKNAFKEAIRKVKNL